MTNTQGSEIGGLPRSFRADPAAALGLFGERGFHIERGIVPAARCERLVEIAATLPNARDGSFSPIPMPHREHPAFLDMMRFAPIVAIVETLVGGRASGIGGEFFYMRPGTPGFSKHQDNYYVQAPPDAFVSAWTALCDVDPENGGLIFFPGSHKLGALPVIKREALLDAGQNPGAQSVETILPGAWPPLGVRLERGSVAFFHSHLVHSSSSNSSQRFRYSLLTTYLRANEPFRPGLKQERKEIDLHEL